MGCCGKKRSTIRAVEHHETPRVTFTPRASSVEYFEYYGTTGMTAFGPVTRRRYRFASPGAMVAVDERDAPSLAAVPNLRKSRLRE